MPPDLLAPVPDPPDRPGGLSQRVAALRPPHDTHLHIRKHSCQVQGVECPAEFRTAEFRRNFTEFRNTTEIKYRNSVKFR